MKFSVLMAVYAGDDIKAFNKAIESILISQTLEATEIVLVVDGPIGKDLRSAISKWEGRSNNRLRPLFLIENLGLAKALNFGIQHCNYEIIVRMDADDVALPSRFEIQVNFLFNRPELTCCSGYVEVFDDRGNTSVRRVPQSNEDICKVAKYKNPLNHPAVAFYRSKVLSVGGYPNFRTSQDYALWCKLVVEGHMFSNIPQVLVRMRGGDGLLRRRGLRYFWGEVKVLQFQYTIGFLNSWELFRNCFLRFFLRMVPLSIRGVIYAIVER